MMHERALPKITVLLAGLFLGCSSAVQAKVKTADEWLILRAPLKKVERTLVEILTPQWSWQREQKRARKEDISLIVSIESLKQPQENYTLLHLVREKRDWPAGNLIQIFTKDEIQIYKELLKRLGIPKHHRIAPPANKKVSLFQASQIALRLEYDRNIYRPTGLVPITLPGVSGQTEALFDIHVGNRILALIDASKRAGLSPKFTSTFRPAPKQWQLYQQAETNPYPVATPGSSSHEAGFAFDVSIRHWSEHEYEKFRVIAEVFGFHSIPGDPIHFEANPVDFGYPSREEAIQKNQIDYYKYHHNQTKTTKAKNAFRSERSPL